MRVHSETLERKTSANTDVHDLTADVERAVAGSGVAEGMVLVFTPGSTAGITTLEFESGCVADLTRVMEELAPSGGEYAHNLRWGDGNGYSHVRAALLGPSLTLPVVEGEVRRGTWQQIVLCDFDNRPRRRRVVVQVMGRG
ncbi:MAG: secondary thiamine-phosphate synthase enzyme YjbQ [Thermoanaerobaculia bacterium]|nr:secondary thiamine-phosphate synthase enzyme YjbQ [Thermoanaerobaculia bacterium]